MRSVQPKAGRCVVRGKHRESVPARFQVHARSACLTRARPGIWIGTNGTLDRSAVGDWRPLARAERRSDRPMQPGSVSVVAERSSRARRRVEPQRTGVGAVVWLHAMTSA